MDIVKLGYKDNNYQVHVAEHTYIYFDAIEEYELSSMVTLQRGGVDVGSIHRPKTQEFLALWRDIQIKEIGERLELTGKGIETLRKEMDNG